jgi:hypothetical protein
MKPRLLPIAGCGIVAAILLGAAAGGAPPLAESAAKQRPHRTNLERSKDLWATVNVCDTEDNPDTIGIRGSMPGLRDRSSRLRMRFQVQYLAEADGKWHNPEDGSATDSGWVRVGRSRTVVLEAGRNFEFLPPEGGGTHHLRGSIRFKWLARKSGKVLARARRITEAGHKSTAGADPKDYSAAECEIS